MYIQFYRDFQICISAPVISLCWKNLNRVNLNRVIVVQPNINSIRNKFDFLGEGIKRKADVLMISET